MRKEQWLDLERLAAAGVAACFLCWTAVLLAYDGGGGTGLKSSTAGGVGDWKFTTSVTYETGKFGTNTRTNTVYVPFTIRRYFDRADVSLTVPYLYQETGPGVAALGGRPFQIRQGGGGSANTSSGLGDVLLGGGYDLLREYENPFNLSAVGRIKFPTADRGDGLGTGEFDETLGLEASKRLNKKWIPFVGLYYTFIGDPPGVNLNNQFAFDLGVGYEFTPLWTFRVFYEQRTALLDGRDDPRDLFFRLERKINQTTKLFGGFSVGLSDGSPDAGVTLGAGFRF